LWDHVGGCFPIVQALRVETIADSGQSYGGRAFRDCLTDARVRHVPVVLVRDGMRYATDDGVTLDALGPREPLLADGPNDVNENSVVLRLTYACRGCAHPFRMLFTGDAGAQSEARMLADGFDLSAEILKVGHHGSAYSSTPAFLAAVHARDALISVGRHNLFGHPAPGTIRAFHDAGTRVYRTDLQGAITVNVRSTAMIEAMLPDESREPVPGVTQRREAFAGDLLRGLWVDRWLCSHLYPDPQASPLSQQRCL
jgi:competence protein ComEC